MSRLFHTLKSQLVSKEVPAASLAFFRIVFGGMMLISIVRFGWRGWIHEFYIAPKVFFPFIESDIFHPLSGNGMYWVFGLMGLSALFILLGLFYRISVLTFFLTFTWVELLDKTNYLNHYYFVSIISFLMIWIPAGRVFSLDVLLRPGTQLHTVPSWMLNILRLQLGMVYFFAGLAKLNPDWLLHALPLKIWLPAKSHLLLIGPLLNEEYAAFAFSWAGALYDLCIPFFLIFRRTRPFAYLAVIVFHVLTALLFNIGMFPWIMIFSSLIFFSPDFHAKLLRFLGYNIEFNQPESPSPTWKPAKVGLIILACHFSVQLILPFRYLAYPGDLFWTEQGYRFSWRVMLMEKSGYAVFHVQDPLSGRKSEIQNSDFLTPYQEKMMSTQPDMIHQYAMLLADAHQQAGLPRPKVFANVHVNLNGRGSQPYTHPEVDLASVPPGSIEKFILPFQP